MLKGARVRLELATAEAVRHANRALARGKEVVRIKSSGAEERLGFFGGALLWDESFLWGLFCYRALERLGFPFEVVRAAKIAERGLEGFDLVVVPGGWASQKSRALGSAGREALRGFVAEGGGYLGFCGGAGLALSVEEGLALVPAARKPFEERLPNFSGSIMVYPGDRPHPMWEGASAPSEVKVWWPSQFEILDPSSVTVAARYGAPSGGFFVSDVEVARVNEREGGFEDLEAFYGINLDPARIEGQPAVLSAGFGRGQAVLSYPHLDTPEDGPGSVMLFNLWQNLGRGRRAGRDPLEWSAEKKAPAPDPEAALMAAGLLGDAKRLIELGEQRGLWRFRNPWLMVWRRGVRGFEFNTLYVMLRELHRLLEGGSAPGVKEGLAVVEERLRGFFPEALAVIDAGGGEGWEELLGPFPGHNTPFMEMVKEMDEMIFALVAGPYSKYDDMIDKNPGT